ncbi:MAG: hypothetical protein IPM61_12910 [Chlorobi bacterium]|nr:MAG: hypothetical protein UZ07_CHB004001696 [Chlorobi bacterium OLB7]MBK8912216.1 hypothetical protein [Chlorobiota bacterium]MBX7215934.1 hypothetical protein [Candidatus Kapabacteria bacterium]
MNTADLITSFFNNELNADQERQFLLSVAASDSMRLGLKSHVMLDKILADNASELHISDSVRNTIFAEAEAVLASNGASSGGGSAIAGKTGGASWFQAMRGVFSAKLAAGGMAVALAGFGLGYATHSQLADPSEATSPVQSTLSVPTTLRDQSSAAPVSSVSPSTSSIAAPAESERADAAKPTLRRPVVGKRSQRVNSILPAKQQLSEPTSPQLPEVPALKEGGQLLPATTDTLNNQTSVTSYDGLQNPIPSANVRVNQRKPNRDSSNPKQQEQTTTP